MVPAFAHCESHPGRLLVDHLSDVSGRLREPLLRLAALCHDVGKGTTYFQDYLHNQSPRDARLKRHSHLGAEVLLEVLWEDIDTSAEAGAQWPLLAYMFVRRHHGALDDLADALSATEEQRKLLALQGEALDEAGLRGWLAGQGHGLRKCWDKDRVGLRVKAQRALAIETDRGICMARFQRALYRFGALIESDRDSAAGFARDFFDAEPRYTLSRVEAYRSGLPNSNNVMSRVRNRLFSGAAGAAARHHPDRGALWTLTSPTGSGKTLAALAWAFHRRALRAGTARRSGPVVYALPFTSIIDQNAAVLQRMYGGDQLDESILSVHHHLAEPGFLMEQGEESLARNWTEGWRADCVCTTFVQVVNALFHATAWDARRLNHLANGVLILDEVQGIPAHFWPVIRESLLSLSKEFGADVLLMTATQPAIFEKDEAVEIAPKEVASEPAFNRYDLFADAGGAISLPDAAELVRRELANGGAQNCLVILNTIQEALDLLSLIATAPWAAGYRHFHLSTNLRPKDRRRILEEIGASPNGAILVATQVVEAGLDFSFDVVLRALGPLDSIVQAAGRCNRHGAGARGRVRILNLSGNSGTTVYGNVHMDVATSLYREISGRAVPEPEVQRLVFRYFQELKCRISQDRAREILKAVQMMEFASLRGEGLAKDIEKKQVVLIEDERYRIAHFVETDESDRAVWERFQGALKERNRWERQRAIRAVRNELGQRVVEVPRRCALRSEPNPGTGLVYVGTEQYRDWYSQQTGWRRSR